MPGTLPDLSAYTLVLGLAAAGLGAFLAYYYRLRPARLVLRQPAVPSGPLTYGAANERRAGFRRRGGRVKVQLADASGKAELGSGWVIDRSTGGLCLTVNRRFEAGELLSVRPAHAPGRTPWVQVEVKSCRQRSGVWEAGCQFVHRPSLNVLLHFG
jgi:hypothetical protein